MSIFTCGVDSNKSALARLMTSAREGLTRSEAILVAVIEENVPELAEARAVIRDLQWMI